MFSGKSLKGSRVGETSASEIIFPCFRALGLARRSQAASSQLRLPHPLDCARGRALCGFSKGKNLERLRHQISLINLPFEHREGCGSRQRTEAKGGRAAIYGRVLHIGPCQARTT